MKPQSFDAEAVTEFDEAAKYYEAQTEGVGVRFRNEVRQALDRVAANPALYRRVGRTALRKCKVRDFPYFVYFLERPTYIWIAAVAHASRRPGYWRGRQPPG